MKRLDLSKKTFGILTVEKWHHKKQYRKNNVVYRTVNYWECICACGERVIVTTENLKSGHTKSCGCLKHISYNTSHLLSDTRIYKIYFSMKARCYNEKNPAYKHYGNRGISICQEWLDDFMNFYNWAINNGYKDNLSIDRIDVNGNYCPDNCRWVSMKIQANNRTNNKFLVFNGKSHTLNEWAHLYKMSASLLRARLHKLKWSFEKAITTTPDDYKNRGFNLIEYKGEFKTKEEWLKTFKIHPSTFYRKLKKYRSSLYVDDNF